MWFMVCHWPQSQEGDWVRHHLCKLARHGPWSGRKQFIRDHVLRGRSKPGCQTAGLVTIVWLTTEVDDQSSLHNCFDRCHVWPNWASRCKPWRWMLIYISMHRPFIASIYYHIHTGICVPDSADFNEFYTSSAEQLLTFEPLQTICATGTLTITCCTELQCQK